jgi:hypothetical protein
VVNVDSIRKLEKDAIAARAQRIGGRRRNLTELPPNGDCEPTTIIRERLQAIVYHQLNVAVILSCNASA